MPRGHAPLRGRLEAVVFPSQLATPSNVGTLRLLLALAVVVAHVKSGGLFGFPFFGNTAYQAVSCFFIISGFYMALVLRTKYGDNTKAFYSARIIRLAPVYLFTLLLFFVLQGVAALFGKPLGVWFVLHTQTFSFLEYAWGLLANLTGISSEMMLLTSFITDSPVKNLLVLAVVWSLGVEIVFYLLAPLILRRSVPLIVCLFLVAMALRLAVSWWNGFSWTAWNYFFFPTNLCFFLAGALAWCALECAGSLRRKSVGWLCWGVLVACVTFGDPLFGQGSVGLLYAACVACIGPVFHLTKDWWWDRAVGELSYPLYLVHWGILTVYAPLRHIVPSELAVYFVAGASIVLSLLLLRLEGMVRQRRALA